MSFGGGSSNDGGEIPQFKKFVSEEELEEKRKQRQAEWEKVRTEDQPLEAPEEEYDPRSLFDRLQEQKQAKQDEYEEQFKLKNQVKGLGREEVDFLAKVSDQQVEIERERRKEQNEIMEEVKQAMSSTAADTTAASKSSEKKPARQQMGASKAKSQMTLLAGAVKRKSTDGEGQGQEKKVRPSEAAESTSASVTEREVKGQRSEAANQRKPQTAQVIGILPGVGAYSNSSGDSDLSSSESDDPEIPPTKSVMHISMKVQTDHGH